MLGDVLHLDGVAQVGLVGTVFLDRIVIGDTRKRRRHRFGLSLAASGSACKLLEQPAHHRLDGLEHVLLLDETHLQVELVELTGRTVGARILVAEAGRDLEVAVEARDHDQLLELLRRLRQGVELARMHARRHQEVARALRRRRGEDRRLELEEAGVTHTAPDRADDLIAQQDILVQRLAPQVQEAVLETQVLGIFRIAEHRDGQFLGRRQHLDLAGEQLHLAGRQLPVYRALGPVTHLAVDADHPL